MDNLVSTITFSIYEGVDLFGQRLQTVRVHRDGEMIYEREYGYDLETEHDYISNYLSQTKI